MSVGGPPALRGGGIEPHWGVYPALIALSCWGIMVANRMRGRALNVTTSRRVHRATLLLAVALGAAVYHWVTAI